jgi:hemolysin III
MSDYGPAHEKANIATHLIGFLFGVIAIPILLFAVVSSPFTGAIDVVGVIVYGIGFLMVFGFSSLYHFHQKPARRRQMKMWDHISIYYLIAGTFTPFLLAYAAPEDARLMLYILWGIAIGGTLFKVFTTGKYRLVSTLMYLAMGWLVIFSPESFQSSVPENGVFWIISGGVAYTAGTVFYMVKKIPFHHAIWHVFVLAGAVCHYVGVWGIYG